MSNRRRQILNAAFATGAVWSAILLSACGGGARDSTSTIASTSQAASTAATHPTRGRGSASQGGALQNATAADFAARLFAKPAAAENRFLPLKPGMQWVREGLVNVGSRRLPHTVVTTVAAVSKEVDGVKSVAILDQDTNGGEIAEQSIDWVAEDAQGNVWYLGSYTESYSGGQFLGANDAWLAGVNAKPGILMLADPQAGTPAYTEDTVPGIEAPTAQVVKADESQCVPFRCFKGVLVVQEGSEYKYFAPGVGQIKTAPQASGGKQEVENLVNVKKLSPGGLKQISDLVLKLDQHAAAEVPDVFGSAPASKPTT